MGTILIKNAGAIDGHNKQPPKTPLTCNELSVAEDQGVGTPGALRA